MPRRDWIEQRLQNWARWKISRTSDAALGYGSASTLGDSDGGRSGYISAPVPILSAEADETDRAVGLLYPAGLRLTVWEYYVGAGSLADKAARLSCGTSTVLARIERAHDQLAEHFLAQQQRRDAERARVEALQRGTSTS